MIASVAALDSRTDVGSEEERLGHLKRASLTTLRAISDIADPPGAAALIGAIRQLPGDADALAIWRGRVDAHALRLRFSNAALHSALRPSGAAAPLFDALEQCRVEALGTRLFPGARTNLVALHRTQESDSTQQAMIEAARSCFDQRSAAQPHRTQQADATLRPASITAARSGFDHGSATQSHRTQQQDIVMRPASSEAARDRIVRGPAAQSHQTQQLDTTARPTLIAAARSGFEQRSATHSHDEPSLSLPLSRLAELLHDQREFGIEAARFAVQMARGERSDAEAVAEPTDERSRSEAEANTERPQLTKSAAVQAESAHVDILRRISNEPRGRVVPRPTASEAGETGYRAFTRQFDAVVDASSLIDEAKRRELARQFEDISAASRRNVSRWAHRLQRYLLSRQRRSWTFDCEEGLLDSGRLARVVCDPLLPLLFKQETDTDWPETAVTLLIDNSGSMRGLPIVIASVCAEQLGAVLERCGVTTEILGFTTQRWRGGRSRERWIAERRPSNPGRLTDLNHIIYKSADVPWRHARRNLIAMLDESLLKENVDGEALLWACQRLRRRPERRKILMVISDGAPLDDATLSANDFGYLDRHLRSVIAALEADAAIELLAIGIGHDVGSYYANAFTVTEPQELGEAMVRQLVAHLKAGL